MTKPPPYLIIILYLLIDQGRLAQEVHTKNVNNQQVTVLACTDEATQVGAIRRQIDLLRKDCAISYNSIAVLCRTNQLCNRFATLMVPHEIPHKLVRIIYPTNFNHIATILINLSNVL